MPWLDMAGACAEPERMGELNGCLEGACALAEEETALWKPLVLLIPLRLGLSDINEAYIETLKVRYFSMYIPVVCVGETVVMSGSCHWRMIYQNEKTDFTVFTW